LCLAELPEERLQKLMPAEKALNSLTGYQTVWAVRDRSGMAITCRKDSTILPIFTDTLHRLGLRYVGDRSLPGRSSRFSEFPGFMTGLQRVRHTQEHLLQWREEIVDAIDSQAKETERYG
jgi:hypothetical protein